MSEKSWNHKGSVLDTLNEALPLNLTDPRDRIYAFQDLPISEHLQKLQILPNYRKSFFEVCKDFALNFLDVYNNPDLLLYVSHEEDSLTRDFPSWIPLWRFEKYPQPIHKRLINRAPLLEKQEPRLSFCARGNGLLVSGFRFAKIRMVSEIFDKTRLTFEGIARVWSQVFFIMETKTRTGLDCFSMFLWALCLGRVWFGKIRYSQDRAAFALEVFKTATGDAKRAINYRRWKMQATGGDAQRFLRHTVHWTARHRRFIITDRGYGMAPVLAQQEDECVIIRGGKMPFLLRNVDGVGNYKLVGWMSHLSEHQQKFGDTGWHSSMELAMDREWTEWGIEEERLCLL